MKYSKRGNELSLDRKAIRASVLAASIMCAFGNAAAVNLSAADSDLAISWGNTVRYNAGWRAHNPDSSIASDITYGQSDLKFGKGDMVTNRVDLLSELNVSYKDQFGARVSAAAWGDYAYRDHSVTLPSNASGVGSYSNNQYSPLVKRYYNGPSAELLDALVFARFDAGIPIDLRAGRMTNYWGENLFFGSDAISYSQSPLDARKALSSPGIETKEVFLPIGQIAAKAQLTSDVSLAAQYYFEWRPTRMPAAGTYLGPADILPQGIDQFPLLGFKAVDPVTPKDKKRNWGASVRWNVAEIDGGLGFYYREFDDYNGWLNIAALPVPVLRYVYPKGVKLYGMSLATTGPLGGTVGAELSYRKNDALALNDNMALGGAAQNEGPRGNTWHAVVNGIWLLGPTPLWETGTLVAELAYSRLGTVTEHPELFKGEGYVSCAGIDRSYGCATRSAWGAAVSFTPSWLQVSPGLDLEMPISINYGLKGNGASNNRTLYEGSYNWSAGLNFKYHVHTDITLAYNGYHADRVPGSSAPPFAAAGFGNGGFSLNDRGWVSLTLKTSF